MGLEIVEQVEVPHEDSIIMGDEVIPYVHHQNPIIMGAEIIEQVQVDQPENPVIMGAEIIQHVEVQPEDPNHWTIRKFLTESDINSSSRLLIGRNEVLRHIAPFFTDNPSEFCQNNERIYTIVYDVNTHTGHTLTLAKWKTNSFVLINNWLQQFVKRRLLMVNDEVGLRWDAYNARLEFTVLRRHEAEG
ncbi:B3 domain-containing protein [Abeliophyllum distichum]|uniref:B3 domain-containing protein n=1 Tax=Abeliophyllum distichum TaxID=126358 RepID=A0ABD1QYK9_9LAMI